MKVRQLVTLFLSLAAASTPAAAAVECVGRISSIMTEPDGSVWVDFGYSEQRVCVLGAVFQIYRVANGDPVTISAAACQGIYSKLLSAQATDRPIRAVYNRTSCSIPPGDPNPGVVQWRLGG